MDRSIPLSKKLRLTLAAGMIPGTTLAAVGDFLAPRGGYFLPFCVGLLAAVVVVCLLLIGSGLPRKITQGDDAMEGWWDGPRHRQLGVWVLSAIAATGLLFGSISYARAQQGGILAGRIDAVAVAQQQLGLMQESVRQQTRTADAIEVVRDTVKRESSEDPVKELANMGQPWSEDGFREALDRKDLRSIRLYLSGGMGGESINLMRLMGTRNYTALDLFEEFSVSASRESCSNVLRFNGYFALNPEDGNTSADVYANRQPDAKFDPGAIRLYRLTCGRYPDLARKTLLVNTCAPSTEACAPDPDPSDPAALARQMAGADHDACVAYQEIANQEAKYCERLLSKLD